MPWIILAAVAMKRFWPAVLVLAIVGSAEMTHNIWLESPPGAFLRYQRAVYAQTEYARRPANVRGQIDRHLVKAREDYEQRRDASRPTEWALTLLSMAAYLYTLVMVVRRRSSQPALARRPASHRKPPRRKT
jgi:hypothetical protein